jgi:hypothetical protein
MQALRQWLLAREEKVQSESTESIFNVGLSETEHWRMCRIFVCYGSNNVVRRTVRNPIIKSALLVYMLCEGL